MNIQKFRQQVIEAWRKDKSRTLRAAGERLMNHNKPEDPPSAPPIRDDAEIDKTEFERAWEYAIRKLYSELKGKKIFADGSFVAPSTYHKDRWVACEKDGMPVTDCGDITYKDSPEEAIELLKSKGLGQGGGK